MSKRSMKIKVTNDSRRESTVVVEPWGDLRPIGPGESTLIHRSGGSRDDIAIHVSEDEIKVWEEGDGFLEFVEEDRG